MTRSYGSQKGCWIVPISLEGRHREPVVAADSALEARAVAMTVFGNRNVVLDGKVVQVHKSGTHAAEYEAMAHRDKSRGRTPRGRNGRFEHRASG